MGKEIEAADAGRATAPLARRTRMTGFQKWVVGVLAFAVVAGRWVTRWAYCDQMLSLRITHGCPSLHAGSPHDRRRPPMFSWSLLSGSSSACGEQTSTLGPGRYGGDQASLFRGSVTVRPAVMTKAKSDEAGQFLRSLARVDAHG